MNDSRGRGGVVWSKNITMTALIPVKEYVQKSWRDTVPFPIRDVYFCSLVCGRRISLWVAAVRTNLPDSHTSRLSLASQMRLSGSLFV